MQRALRIPSVLHPLELLPLSSGLGSTIRGLSSRAEGGPSEQASTSAPDANGSQSSAASALPHQNAWKPDLPPRRVPVRQRIMNLRAKYYQHLFEDEGSQLLKLTRAEMRRQTQPKDATGSSKAAPSAPPAESVPKYTMKWTDDDLFYSGVPPPRLLRDRTPIAALVPAHLKPKGVEGLEYMTPSDFQRVLTVLKSGEIPHAQLLGVLGGPGQGLVATLKEGTARAVAVDAALDFSYLEVAARMGKFANEEMGAPTGHE